MKAFDEGDDDAADDDRDDQRGMGSLKAAKDQGRVYEGQEKLYRGRLNGHHQRTTSRTGRR